MSETSQGYSDDENIAPYGNNVHRHNSNGFAAESQEEHDDHAGEGPIDAADRYHGDGQSVSSSSDIGESDEVSSVVDLDPELQAIKGLPPKTLLFNTTPDCDLRQDCGNLQCDQHSQDPDSRIC